MSVTIEQSLKAIEDHDNWPYPIPDEAHSGYETDQDLIVAQLALGWEQFDVAMNPLIRRYEHDRTGVPPHELATIRLTVGLCGGAAPYVGRPFHYEWDYATDEAGRWVGGPTRIVYDEVES